jgi:hypothetical protein
LIKKKGGCPPSLLFVVGIVTDRHKNVKCLTLVVNGLVPIRINIVVENYFARFFGNRLYLSECAYSKVKSPTKAGCGDVFKSGVDCGARVARVDGKFVSGHNVFSFSFMVLILYHTFFYLSIVFSKK